MTTSPDSNSAAIILEKIQRLQQAVPFEPFVVVTSSGNAYDIPTPDHLVVTRLRHRILVHEDYGVGADLNPLQVTAVATRAQSIA